MASAAGSIVGTGTVVPRTGGTDVVAFYLSCGFEITHVTEGDFGSDTWFALRLGELQNQDGHSREYPL